MIVRLKKGKPHWGARKIRELLVRHVAGDVRIPAKSTVHAVLDRHGLVRRARQRRRHKAHGTPLSEATCCISLCFDKILQIIPMQGRGIFWINSLLQERVTVASLTETYGSTGPLPGLNSLLQ